MRLLPSDPDIETIIGRIKDRSLDLQPNFQRGEVWPISKRQRLIDSILRDWHVPPIHVVVDAANRHLVLDGQQRLAAIRDFTNNLFPIDGTIQPITPELAALNNLHYHQIPEDWKRRFNQFTLRLFRITDYLPSEPGELFFRLNQPAALTAAEQRNAFFGNTREQVKELVTLMQNLGLNEKFWHFSNARMSYDDVIARACLILESKTLKRKITASVLADRYRDGRGFPEIVIKSVTESIKLLADKKQLLKGNPAFNKATAQSWLIFISVLLQQSKGEINTTHLVQYLDRFSVLRQLWHIGSDNVAEFGEIDNRFGTGTITALLQVYEDRSTSRVADISSVVLRDFALWVNFWAFLKGMNYGDLEIRNFSKVLSIDPLDAPLSTPRDIEETVNEINWGDAL